MAVANLVSPFEQLVNYKNIHIKQPEPIPISTIYLIVLLYIGFHLSNTLSIFYSDVVIVVIIYIERRTNLNSYETILIIHSASHRGHCYIRHLFILPWTNRRHYELLTGHATQFQRSYKILLTCYLFNKYVIISILAITQIWPYAFWEALIYF